MASESVAKKHRQAAQLRLSRALARLESAVHTQKTTSIEVKKTSQVAVNELNNHIKQLAILLSRQAI